MISVKDIIGDRLGKVVGNAAVSAAVSLARTALPQMSLMMALGLFVFGIKTIPYQQLQRQRQWRHPSASRVGRRPARQFTGPGDDTITLSATLYPEITGGKVSIALLSAMADTGKAWTLLQGDGTFYGHYVIEDISETASIFFTDGSARKIDFSLKLSRVDDDDIDMLGEITKDLMALI
jgi:phage protein U